MTTLTMTEAQRSTLVAHLFPDDGCEAVAIALCGRARRGGEHRLIVRRLELIPYEACSVRTPDQVTWPTSVLVPLLMEACKRGWAVLKIHGHRGYARFSDIDDHSDRQLFPSVYAWTDSTEPHGSAIVMDDGRVFGRVVHEDGTFEPLSAVKVVGDDIVIFRAQQRAAAIPEYARRVAQTFGAGTFDTLRQLRIGVVGCSGTGSPVIEQLARNCVGELVLVDPDAVEEKNLNRILNTTMADALSGAYKVDVAARTIAQMKLGTKVRTFAKTLFNREVVDSLSGCDVLFGCVDTLDGRLLLNKLASFYAIPYFDLGVKIEADGRGGVDQVCGSVHYLKPGGASLVSRHVFTLEQARVAGLKRTNAAEYESLLAEGYIRGVQEDRPAVIQLNLLIASLAVNELLARVHPYRLDSNDQYATTRVSLSHGIFGYEAEGDACEAIGRHVGKGDVEPPLDWAELSVVPLA
jgi:hypothetical protein